MRAGSMFSASPTHPMPLTLTKQAKSSRPERRWGLAYASMATNSVRVRVFGWLSSWVRPASITAPTLPTPTSTRSPMRRIPLSRRCFRELSFALARLIQMPHGCSRQGSRSPWRLTAIRGRATRVPCRG
jgi:hypothetical protein